MCRSILTALTLLVVAGVANAGGPPPMYAVVEKVVLEPNGDAPERIQIWGSFTRTDGKEYTYSKPVEGYLYFSIAPGKAAESRAEWTKWKQAVGTGKAVAVGTCNEAGTFMTATIRKPSDRADKPDQVYSTDYLGRIGTVYATGNLEREKPVQDLLKFAKELRQASSATDADRRRR